MRFTKEQYEKAIADLQDGMKQLEPDGHCCAICGDDCMAWECRFNPLKAMAWCQSIHEQASELHEWLHSEPECDAQTMELEAVEKFHDFLHRLIGLSSMSPYDMGCRSVLPETTEDLNQRKAG